MIRDIPSGPSPDAAWITRNGSGGASSPPLLTLADAANDRRHSAGLDPITYVVPQCPLLVRSHDGRPDLQLSLLLSELPRNGDDPVFDLIERGFFSGEFTLAVADDQMHAGDRPLFVKSSTLRLIDKFEKSTIAQCEASGANPKFALSCKLSRDQARGLLLALHGRSTYLQLTCDAEYHTAPRITAVAVKLNWADLYDEILTQLAGKTEFSQAALMGWVGDMLEAGSIEATAAVNGEVPHKAGRQDALEVLSVILKVAGILLERQSAGLAGGDEANVYALRERPQPDASLDLRLSVQTAKTRTLTLSAPLEHVLKDALEDQEHDAFIYLTLADAAMPGGVRKVPRRVKSMPRSRDAMSRTPKLMIEQGNKLVSITNAIRSGFTVRPSAHALLSSDAVKPLAGLHGHFMVDDVFIRWPGQTELDDSMPDASSVESALMPDWRGGLPWYRPSFQLVSNPAANPEQSPFQFTFHEIGHANSGLAMLEGEIVFTLRSDATPQPGARPVPTHDLSVSVLLPVRDPAGALTKLELAAKVEQAGNQITCRVGLCDPYVRAAYGALALAGFQPEQAQVRIGYTFKAMFIDTYPFDDLVWFGKLQRLPIAYDKLQARTLEPAGPFLNAATLALHAPGAEISFRREIKPSLQRGTGEAAWRRPASMVAAIKPELIELQPRIQLPDRRKRYIQTQVDVQLLDFFFPCTTHGSFYRQDLGDRFTAIGCQDSFSLGRVPARLYEELHPEEFQSEFCKVYRSLLQPGIFVVLPAAYRITRYEPDDAERAYRPAIYMYTTIDAENAGNNRCVVLASLQPDIPRWARRELQTRLQRLSHNPQIRYATELDAELAFSWQIDGNASAIACQAVKLWDSFQVSLSTDLAGGLLLQQMLTHNGVAAHVRFTLPDGSDLGPGCDLVLDLARLTGPFIAGPLSVTTSPGVATIENRLRHAVNVSSLVSYDSGGAQQHYPVNQQISASAAIEALIGDGAHDVYPVYAEQPAGAAGLAEVVSFLEDIHTNIIAVNLINLAERGLRSILLRVRLAGVVGSDRTLLLTDAQPVAEAEFILPITSYLSVNIAQFQAVKTDAADVQSATGWIDWDLKTNGNVFSITWNMFQ